MSRVVAGGRRAAPYPTPWLGASIAVAMLTVLPLGYVVVGALGVPATEIATLVWRPRVGELLVNTVSLTVVGTAACVVLGVTTAWLVERTDLPGRPVWTALMVAPLAVPAFVNSFGWYSLAPSMQGLWAAVLVTTLSYYPLVYLPVAATLRGMDPAFEEAARAMGCGPGRTFARVVAPQLRPALFGGALLVGLHLLAEFGALQALRFATFTTAIYDQFQSTFNGSAATMLAGVLVLLCLVLLVGEARWAGRVRTARVGRGSARAPVVRPLRGALVPAGCAMGAVVALSLGVPLGSIGYWLTTSRSAAFPGPALWKAAGSTLGLGAVAAVVTVALALPVAWLVVRHPGSLSRIIERSTFVGSSLPGIVVALALITVAVGVVPVLYQSLLMLIAAYAVLFMPRAMVSLRAALAQVPPELDDAARALGVGPRGVLVRVTLPMIVRGLGSGAALVFLAVVTELTSTLLLAPIGTRTLATQFWSSTSAIKYGAAAPYALLMIVLSAPVVVLLTRRSRLMEADVQ